MSNPTQNSNSERVVHTQWLKRSTNTFIPTDNSVTTANVDAGVYNIRYVDNIGLYMFKKEIVLDELIELPFPESKTLIQGIEKFWKLEDKFKEYKYSYKRGILLYGVPGGGKTSIINMLCKKLIEEKGGVVFTISDAADLDKYSRFLSEIFRIIEPKRPIITIIEDIDGMCQDKSVETQLLNVLDGIEQADNIVYLATTNYTERLSDRILNRPNRFDIRVEVKSPNTECRKLYFEHKLKPKDLKAIDLDMWIRRTEGLTMASLGEIIKSVIILENDFDETLERLGGMKQIPNSRNYNAEFNKKIGF